MAPLFTSLCITFCNTSMLISNVCICTFVSAGQHVMTWIVHGSQLQSGSRMSAGSHHGWFLSGDQSCGKCPLPPLVRISYGHTIHVILVGAVASAAGPLIYLQPFCTLSCLYKFLLSFGFYIVALNFFFARKATATYIENKGTVQTFLTERTLVNNEMTTRSLPLLFPFFLRNCRHRTVASDLQHAIHHLSNSRSGHPTLISCRRYSIREHSHRLPRIGRTSADNHQPRRAEPLPRSGETTASNNSKEEDTYHHKTVAAVERTVEETPRR